MSKKLTRNSLALSESEIKRIAKEIMEEYADVFKKLAEHPNESNVKNSRAKNPS